MTEYLVIKIALHLFAAVWWVLGFMRGDVTCLFMGMAVSFIGLLMLYPVMDEFEEYKRLKK